MLAQYIGSFAFVATLSESTLHVLRVIGVCSADTIVPLTESLIFGSAAFKQQWSFNFHLMISFNLIAVLCVLMSWCGTRQIARVVVGEARSGDA